MKTNLEIGLTVKYLKRNRAELCTPYRDCKYNSGIYHLLFFSRLIINNMFNNKIHILVLKIDKRVDNELTTSWS